MVYRGMNRILANGTVKSKFGFVTGPKPKYTPEKLQDAIVDYFEQAELPEVLDLAGFLGVHYDTLQEWMTDRSNPLSGIVKAAKERIASGIVRGAMKNKLNNAMSIFWCKNVLGWQDRTEHTDTTADKLADILKTMVDKEKQKQTVIDVTPRIGSQDNP